MNRKEILVIDFNDVELRAIAIDLEKPVHKITGDDLKGWAGRTLTRYLLELMSRPTKSSTEVK